MASGGDVPDFIVDLMSPQSSVDSSTRDRMVVQQGGCLLPPTQCSEN